METIERADNSVVGIVNEVLETIFNPDLLREEDSAEVRECEAYFDELTQRLIDTGLTEKQIKLVGMIEDVHTDCLLAYSEISILHGVKAQSAFQKIINDPLEALEDYRSKSIPVSERYKSREV